MHISLTCALAYTGLRLQSEHDVEKLSAQVLILAINYYENLERFALFNSLLYHGLLLLRLEYRKVYDR